MLHKSTRLEKDQYLGDNNHAVENAARVYFEDIRRILQKDPEHRLLSQLTDQNPVEQEWAVQEVILETLKQEKVDPKKLDRSEWAFHCATIRRALTLMIITAPPKKDQSTEMPSPDPEERPSDSQPSSRHLRVVRP